MTTLEGAPDETYINSVCAKWGMDAKVYPQRCTAMVLENQSRHFQQLNQEAGDGKKVNKELARNLMSGFKRKLPSHPIFQICSVQPLTAPIGIVHWYQHQVSNANVEGRVPEVRLDIQHTEIRAEARRCKALLSAPTSLTELENGPSVGELIQMGVDEYLTELAREILGTMLNMCIAENSGRVDQLGSEKLEIQVSKTAHMIHRQTQRAPANKLIGNQASLAKLGVTVPTVTKGEITVPVGDGGIVDLDVWNGKFRVYFDPLFPDDKIMMWYNSDTSPYDTGLIYSPYIMAQLSGVSLNPPKDMSVSHALRCRHKILLTRPEFFRVIEL